MRDTIVSKSILVCKIAVMSTVVLALSLGAEGLSAESQGSLELRSKAFSVPLDAKVPRVFSPLR